MFIGQVTKSPQRFSPICVILNELKIPNERLHIQTSFSSWYVKYTLKTLICTRGKRGGKCGNGREAVRRKSVANPLQTNYFATSLHACKFNANTKFASDLHIRKFVDYIKLANGLQTCKLVANMKFAIGLHHVLYVRKLVANNKFASDLHIRKCVDYTNYTKPLV